MDTTWNELLLEEAGEDEEIIAKAFDDETVWDRIFDNGYGLAKGSPVLAWSATRVYFPTEYDGSERIASAPRNPQPTPEGHI